MDTAARSPIHEHLAGERTAIALLVTLLRSEQGWLAEASVLALSTLTPEKAALAAAVGDLTRQRHRALADAGYAADQLGMCAWLNSDAGQSALKTWNETLELTRTAQELNRVNGLLIGQQLSRSQRLFNVLQNAVRPAPLYGRNGHTAGAAVGRGLSVG